jgi:hypothetical protein
LELRTARAKPRRAAVLCRAEQLAPARNRHDPFGPSTASVACEIITLMRALADCSVAVSLFDAETENLGLAHAPRPLEPGDLLALTDGRPLSTLCGVRTKPGVRTE